MTSFELHGMPGKVAKVLALGALIAPSASFSQAAQTLQARADREQQIVATIEQEESLNGPFSEDLIGPLTALSLFYEETGDYRAEEAAISQVLQVIRANYGLYSLEQAPFIRRTIDREQERGNAQAAWDLQWDLLELVKRNPDDLRSARILREVGDGRVDVLQRYDAGEFPPEIVLGCFYDDTVAQQEAGLLGSQPTSSVRVGPEGRKCGSGSRAAARRSLAASAQGFFVLAVGVLLRNEDYSNPELRELLMQIVRLSYRFTNPSLGADSLRRILEYEVANSSGWLRRIEAQVQIADWDLLYASDLGTRFEKSARATYEQAYDLLLEQQIAQEAIDAIFSPEIPVVLPAFVENPLVSEETLQSRGYIDISFVIAEDGKSKQIEVLDTTTANVPRAAERDLVQTIKFSRFRPRLTDGRFADSEPIVLRYYLNE